MKMKNEFILRNFLLFFCLIYLHFLHIVDCQRTGIGHRLDVYIAGFFPYKEGVEKSETGKYMYMFELFTDIPCEEHGNGKNVAVVELLVFNFVCTAFSSSIVVILQHILAISFILQKKKSKEKSLFERGRPAVFVREFAL